MEFCKRIGLSLLRIWLGYLWLIHGLARLQAGGVSVGPASEQVAAAAGEQAALEAWYVGAAPGFAAYCAIIMGIALLLGLFTAAAAGTGSVLSLVYLFQGESALHLGMYVIAVALVVGRSAAGYYGLDRHIQPLFGRMVRSASQAWRGFVSRLARV